MIFLLFLVCCRDGKRAFELNNTTRKRKSSAKTEASWYYEKIEAIMAKDDVPTKWLDASGRNGQPPAYRRGH
jgi:hypothetical protein